MTGMLNSWTICPPEARTASRLPRKTSKSAVVAFGFSGYHAASGSYGYELTGTHEVQRYCTARTPAGSPPGLRGWSSEQPSTAAMATPQIPAKITRRSITTPLVQRFLGGRLRPASKQTLRLEVTAVK